MLRRQEGVRIHPEHPAILSKGSLNVVFCRAEDRGSMAPLVQSGALQGGAGACLPGRSSLAALAAGLAAGATSLVCVCSRLHP
jgi:hypothetical protein